MLTSADKRWMRETFVTKGDLKEELNQLRTDLIGEGGRMMVEIKRHIRERMAVYHPEESK